jgi:hypothetical protein
VLFGAGALGEPLRLRHRAARAVHGLLPSAARLLAAQTPGPAADAFVDARRLYEKSAAQAARALAAEQAREAMQAAKQRAQRDGAQCAGHGAKREAQAEAELAQGAFAEAERAFREAQAAYEKEGKEAGTARRGAAERARDEARTAREAAVASGAQRQAATAFREAEEQEKRARSSFQSGELVQAAEQFASARGTFERAARDAQEVARQEVEKTRIAPRQAPPPPADDATRLIEPGDFDATILVPRGSQAAAPLPDDDATVLQPADADATVLQPVARPATHIPPTESPDATRLVGRPSSAATPPADAEATIFQPRAALEEQTRAQPAPQRAPVAPVKPRPEAAPSSPVARYAALGAAALVAVVLAVYLLRPGGEPSVPEAPPAPLAWGRTMPLEKEAALAPGKSVWFGAEVQNAPAGTDVRYSWRIDGQERATGSSWEYAPGPEEAGKTREVKVVASIGTQQLERAWTVRVEGAGRPPAVAANRPPVIASQSPQAGSVPLESGASQVFAVTARDPDEGDALTYSWEHNGRSAAQGPESSWTLQDAQDGDEVRVTVRDKAGLSAGSQEWRMAIAKPPPPPTPTPPPAVAPTPPPVAANVPPKILGEVPPARKLVSVQEGGTVDFSVRADDDGRLAYVWFLDGREVGRNSTWQFRAPTAVDAKATHKVEAEVADDGGLKAPRVAWNVEVTWAPPRIVSYTPKERQVVAEAGTPTRFSASARTTDGGSTLTYEWTLDGGPAARVPEGRFETPASLSPGEHMLQLTAVDARGSRSAPQRWTVAVGKREAAPPVPPPPPPPSVERLTEADVREWLNRYKSAYESRQVDALQRIGVVSAAQAEAVSKALAGYKSLQVTVSNERITLQGQNATVSFDRSDRDETGKTMPYPKQTWRLQKSASGVVATGRAP